MFSRNEFWWLSTARAYWRVGLKMGHVSKWYLLIGNMMINHWLSTIIFSEKPIPKA
jgi:hypothetical protein